MRFFKEIWTFIQLFFTGMDKSKTELEPGELSIYFLGNTNICVGVVEYYST